MSSLRNNPAVSPVPEPSHSSGALTVPHRPNRCEDCVTRRMQVATVLHKALVYKEFSTEPLLDMANGPSAHIRHRTWAQWVSSACALCPAGTSELALFLSVSCPSTTNHRRRILDGPPRPRFAALTCRTMAPAAGPKCRPASGQSWTLGLRRPGHRRRLRSVERR